MCSMGTTAWKFGIGAIEIYSNLGYKNRRVVKLIGFFIVDPLAVC